MLRFIKTLITVSIVVFALSCGSGGGGEESPSEPPVGPSDPTLLNPTYDPTLPVRGVAFFSLMHPKVTIPDASGVSPLDSIIEISKESSRPGIAFPWRTFGNQIENYIKLVDALIDAGKPPVIQIYGDCSPCRKGRGTDGSWSYLASQLDIKQFNSAIQFDAKVRSDYINLVEEIRSFMLLYPNLRYIYVPVMEDNLDDKGFKAILDLTIQVFGNMPNVEVRRNSVVSNNAFGHEIELHDTTLATLNNVPVGGAMNWDGDCHNFPEQSYPQCVSWDEIRNVIVQARATNKDLWFWEGEWQGRIQGSSAGAVHPDLRTYQISHVNELKELITLP